MVPRAGLEPARPYEHYALNVACLPISAPRHWDDTEYTLQFASQIWQERRDSNPRPLVLETSALARLSYAPARSKQRAKRERPLITRSTQSYLDEY